MLFCARVTGLLLHEFLKIRHTLLRAETDKKRELNASSDITVVMQE